LRWSPWPDDGGHRLAWHRVGRASVSFGELLRAPTYALAKIPIYVRLFTARQRQWIRTKRDGDR
jgi:hypothetical protein